MKFHTLNLMVRSLLLDLETHQVFSLATIIDIATHTRVMHMRNNYSIKLNKLYDTTYHIYTVILKDKNFTDVTVSLLLSNSHQ